MRFKQLSPKFFPFLGAIILLVFSIKWTTNWTQDELGWVCSGLKMIFQHLTGTPLINDTVHISFVVALLINVFTCFSMLVFDFWIWVVHAIFG
jgi:hypothetical protein